MTKILCYDIHYKNNEKGPLEVQVLVNLPKNWYFEFIPARNAVKQVLEATTKLEVAKFEWRPLE